MASLQINLVRFKKYFFCNMCDPLELGQLLFYVLRADLRKIEYLCLDKTHNSFVLNHTREGYPQNSLSFHRVQDIIVVSELIPNNSGETLNLIYKGHLYIEIVLFVIELP